jgi:hypothetical protein
MLLACFVDVLDYRSFFYLEFSRMHDNLKLALTVSGTKGKSAQLRTDLTSFHYRESETNHSYWVVRSSPGLTGDIPIESLSISDDFEVSPPSPDYRPVSPVHSVETAQDGTPLFGLSVREDVISTLVDVPKKNRAEKRRASQTVAAARASLGAVVIRKPPGLFDPESE